MGAPAGVFISGGIGVAGLLAGAVTGALALSKASSLTQSEQIKLLTAQEDLKNVISPQQDREDGQHRRDIITSAPLFAGLSLPDTGADRYVLDLIRDRLNLPETLLAVRRLSAKWPERS